MGRVTVRVPAKINLQLSVGPLRPDGFHELATVFQAVSLYDEVTAESSDTLRVVVEGDSRREVPTGKHNLATKAALMLARHVARPADVCLTLRKRIPVAGGMAGGSADAAATLVACDALWELGLGRDVLTEVAAELGSDVPFALLGGTAVGTGRGELLTPALASGSFTWVLALADEGLSTPEVFAECDRLRSELEVPEPQVSAPLMAALRTGDPAELGDALTNDLQPAALSLRPALGQVLESGLRAGALGALLSGSGPTCAFLAESDEAAVALADRIRAIDHVRDVLVAQGPVHGARIVGPRLSLAGES